MGHQIIGSQETKVKKYQKAIMEVLTAYQELTSGTNNGDVKEQIVVDEKNHHYQLLSIGWSGHQYWFDILFHLDIIGEQIWLQQNKTEHLIADELVNKGVAKSDIVLGFVYPEKRPYSGFAAT